MKPFIALILVALQGCIVTPQVSHVYDQRCGTYQKSLSLKPHYLGGGFNCGGGDECAALLLAFGAVGAASVLVSGSIMVVGNTVCWFEHRGQCEDDFLDPI